MLLHLPAEDVELLGITTVYGFTDLRAKVAKSILDAYNSIDSDLNGEKRVKREVPVLAGESVVS
jgi:hypothetical protein